MYTNEKILNIAKKKTQIFIKYNKVLFKFNIFNDFIIYNNFPYLN